MKRKLINLLGAVFCIVLLTQTVFAASLNLPVTIKLKGNVPSVPEKFTVELKADDASYPMPEGAEKGVYSMVIYGADTVKIPAVTYDRVGIYTYTIRQIKGSNPKCTYDNTVYRMKVTVTNSENGEGLSTVTAIHAGSSEDKTDEVVFTNSYRYESSDTPQTNDESNFPLDIALAAGSILVLVALFLTRKRKEDVA